MTQNKIKLTALAFASVLLGGCVHNIQNISVPSDKILSYNTMKQAEANGTIKDMVESINSAKIIVFKLEKGEKIPLNLKLKTSYLDLIEANNTMIAKKDLYLLIDTQNGIYVSANAKEWANLNDFDTVKKVLDIKTLDFSFHYDIDQNSSKADIGLTETNN